MNIRPKLRALLAAKPFRWLLLGLTALVVLLAFLWRPLRFLPFATLHPHTQAVFRQLGIAPEQVTQGLEMAAASAGIHSADGMVNGRPYCAAFDLDVSSQTPEQTRFAAPIERRFSRRDADKARDYGNYRGTHRLLWAMSHL